MDETLSEKTWHSKAINKEGNLNWFCKEDVKQKLADFDKELKEEIINGRGWLKARETEKIITYPEVIKELINKLLLKHFGEDLI